MRESDVLNAQSAVPGERVAITTATALAPQGEKDRESVTNDSADARHEVPLEASTGSWGHLPLPVREALPVGGMREFPVRYRDWIDAYYQRLNRDAERRWR